MRAIVSALLAAAAVSACATRPGPSMSASEIQRLDADCRARGGMLVPSGRWNPNPALTYLCRTHQATRIPQ